MTKKSPPTKAIGRPRIFNESVTMNIRLTPEQRKKVDDNGGASWVRRLIDRAKGKKE